MAEFIFMTRVMESLKITRFIQINLPAFGLRIIRSQWFEIIQYIRANRNRAHDFKGRVPSSKYPKPIIFCRKHLEHIERSECIFMILVMEVLSITRFIIIRFLGFKFEANQIRSSKIIRFGNRKAEYSFIPRQKVNIYLLPAQNLPLQSFTIYPFSTFSLAHPSRGGWWDGSKSHRRRQWPHIVGHIWPYSCALTHIKCF